MSMPIRIAGEPEIFPPAVPRDIFDKYVQIFTRFEPPHDKINKMACAPSENSDQPGHQPSLIRVFVVRSMGS